MRLRFLVSSPNPASLIPEFTMHYGCLGCVCGYGGDFLQHSRARLPNLEQFLDAKRSYKIGFGNSEKISYYFEGWEKENRTTWEEEKIRWERSKNGRPACSEGRRF